MKNIISKSIIIISIFFFLYSCSWFSKPEVDPEVYVNEGIAHFRAGNDSLAIIAWNKALLEIPDDEEVQNFVGISYHKRGQLTEASRSFKRALEIDSTYYEAANNYGYVLFLLKRYPQAKENFERALKHNPEYEPAIKNLELVKQVTSGSLNIEAFEYSEQAVKNQDYADQIPVFERALKIDPAYAKVHNNLGVALFYEGYFDSAYHHFEEAIKLENEYPEAIHNLGYLNKVNKNYETAVELFLKALTIKPRYIAALNNLGETYYLMQDYSNSRRVFETAIGLDDNNQTAKYYIKELQNIEGE